MSFTDPFGLTECPEKFKNFTGTEAKCFFEGMSQRAPAIKEGAAKFIPTAIAQAVVGMGLGKLAGVMQRVGTGGGSAPAGAIANPVPVTLARVVPGGIAPTTLARAGQAEAFVTDATAVRGLTSEQIAQRLSIPNSPSGFQVIEFSSEGVQGIASPINRTNPGFIGGGRTAGGAPEFVIPNGPIPPGATIRRVP